MKCKKLSPLFRFFLIKVRRPTRALFSDLPRSIPAIRRNAASLHFGNFIARKMCLKRSQLVGLVSIFKCSFENGGIQTYMDTVVQYAMHIVQYTLPYCTYCVQYAQNFYRKSLCVKRHRATFQALRIAPTR